MTWEILNAAIVAVTGISIIGFVLPWILPNANDTARYKLPVLQRLSILPMSLFVCALSFAVSLVAGHHEADVNEFSVNMFFEFGAIMLLYVGDMIYIAPSGKLTLRIIAGSLLAVGGFGIHSMPWWMACLLAIVLVSVVCYTLDFFTISNRMRLISLISLLFCLGIVLYSMDKYPYSLFAVAVASGLTPLVLKKCESNKIGNTIKTRIPAIGAIISLLLLEVILY